MALLMRSVRTKFAERAFSFVGPAEWNCLPSDLRLTTNTNSSKKKYKSALLSTGISRRVSVVTPVF